MRGVKSFGMLMASSDAAHENVELLVPPEDSVPGERIWFGGEDEKESQPELAGANQVQAGEKANGKPKTKGEANVSADSSKISNVEETTGDEACVAAHSDGPQDLSNEGENNVGLEECGTSLTKSSEPHEELVFNPNVFTEFKLAGNQEDCVMDNQLKDSEKYEGCGGSRKYDCFSIGRGSGGVRPETPRHYS